MATDRSPRRWLHLLAAIGAGAILAIVCLGLGLDRMGSVRADGGSPVPAVFQHTITLQRAAVAAGKGRAAESGKLAAAYARGDPMDPNAMAMVATAWLEQGRSADADRAFRAAGALGWRDRVTQSYWLLAAMRLGDPVVAAQRLDALLRTGVAADKLEREILAVESIPRGRAAIAERLGNRPDWINGYAEETGGLVGQDFIHRVEVLALAARRGARPGCAAVGRAVGNQVNAGRYAEGLALWRSQCAPPGESTAYVRDSGFQRVVLAGAVPAFEWVVAGKAGVTVRVRPAPGPGNTRLAGSNENARIERLASQVIMLPPGRYRIAWRAGAAGDGDVPGVALLCRDGPDISMASAVSGTGDRREAFATVPAACPVQTLAVTIPPGAEDAWMDDLVITAA